MDHESNKKCILSTAKVGERGQIVIPKEMRDLFNIESGDTLIVRALEGRGILLVKAEDLLAKADILKDLAYQILENADKDNKGDINKK